MDHNEKKKELDLWQYWRVIVKRKWVVITFASSLVFFTGIFSFLATPLYESSATLLIEEDTSKILNIDQTFGFQPQFVQDLRFFNTQLELLKSKSLAERVVRKINLISRPEYDTSKKQKKNLTATVKEMLSFKWLKFNKKRKDENPNPLLLSNPYTSAADAILRNVEIKPIRDTKLVKLSFTSPSQILAKEVVNALAEEFINFSIEKRYSATQQASDFLSEQIANLREDLAAKERELQRYGQEKEILFLSDNVSAVVNKFSDLYQAYTQAQIERIKAEANYRELKNLKIDSLPQFVNNPIIQQLQTDYTRMKSEHEEKSKLFKSNYPEMIQLKAKLDSMRDGLQNEIKKAVDTAESEYRSALKKENSIKDLLEKQKDDMATMDSDAILYNNIKVEVENMRKLLNSLVERQKETVVSAGLGGLNTSNISIIDKGEIPKNPVSPKKKLNLILALLLGIFGGTGLCFFLEYLDNSVKGPEDVEKLAGLPSLGVIPYFNPEDTKENKKYGYYSRHEHSHEKENPGSQVAMPEIKEIELINHLYPKFFLSEDYRTVRTSILLSHVESTPKAIVFSSALPKEGKTATVVNMAVAFSQLDKKVLIIDADLRKPRLHKVFNVRNLHGLSGCLIGMESLGDSIHQTFVKNIWLLPTGLIPPNPAELLNSKKMKELIEEVKTKFDIILIDSTPVLAVVDAVIISSLADSMVLVIKPGGVTRKAFMSAVEELKRSKVKIIGVVFNGVNARKGDYSFMDYYRYYRSYYYEEEGKQSKKQQIQ